MGGKEQEKKEVICVAMICYGFVSLGLKSYTKIFCELFFFNTSLIDYNVQPPFPTIIPTPAPVADAHPILLRS